MSTLKYKIALTLIPGIGSVTGKKLIAYCGDVEAIFKEKKYTLLKIPGVGKLLVHTLNQSQIMARAEAEVVFIEKNKIKPLFFLDDEYPLRLKHCVDGPLMLYYKGNADLNASRIITVVGTRKPTDYGKSRCKSFIEGLADLNVLITSGLAYGIDSIAHRVALDLGLKTTGVLAHGLDRIYPAQNRTLAERMIHQGGLITEFLCGTIPDRENFPKRNRIVAGMADAVLVVESAVKGGALITADIANSYNRDVFAIPGRLSDEYSQGCNYLIKINKAALVQSVKDIKYIMGWEPVDNSGGIQQKLFTDLTREEKIIIDVLRQHGQLNIDKLSGLVQMSAGQLSVVLLNLEFEGLIRNIPGKIYKIV